MNEENNGEIRSAHFDNSLNASSIIFYGNRAKHWIFKNMCFTALSVRSSSNNSSIDAIFLLKAWQKWNQHPKILIPVCNWWNACRSAFSKSMIMPDPFISISSSWTYFRRLSTLPSFYGTLEHTRLDIISFLHRHDWTENLLFDVLNAQNIQTLRAFEILFGFLRNFSRASQTSDCGSFGVCV